MRWGYIVKVLLNYYTIFLNDTSIHHDNKYTALLFYLIFYACHKKLKKSKEEFQLYYHL